MVGKRVTAFIPDEALLEEFKAQCERRRLALGVAVYALMWNQLNVWWDEDGRPLPGNLIAGAEEFYGSRTAIL